MSIRKLTGAAVSVAALLGVPAAAIPAVGPGYGSPVPALGTPSSKPPLPMYEHGGRRTLAPISVVASMKAMPEALPPRRWNWLIRSDAFRRRCAGAGVLGPLAAVGDLADRGAAERIER